MKVAVSWCGLPHQEHQERKGTMEKVRIFFDREGNTLSVWFDDPKKEHVCEESDDDVILVKDRRGRVIGFERLNFLDENFRPFCAVSHQGNSTAQTRSLHHAATSPESHRHPIPRSHAPSSDRLD